MLILDGLFGNCMKCSFSFRPFKRKPLKFIPISLLWIVMLFRVCIRHRFSFFFRLILSLHLRCYSLGHVYNWALIRQNNEWEKKYFHGALFFSSSSFFMRLINDTDELQTQNFLFFVVLFPFLKYYGLMCAWMDYERVRTLKCVYTTVLFQ